MNTQIISGDDIPYVSDNVNKNHTNVMYVKIDSASLSSTDYMALYKKTRIMNDRHYIISADVYRNGSSSFNVALCTDTDNIKYYLKNTRNYKNALEISTDRLTNLDGYNSFIRNASWNNYAIEVNKDTNTVTFYINNIPMYTGTVDK
jgi:hypothetical protein